MIKILQIFIVFLSTLLVAQVGVNTTAPTETLDINGSLRIRNVNLVGPAQSAKDSIMVFDADGVVKYVSANSVVAQSTAGNAKVLTNATLSGDGSTANSLSIAQQGATTGQILMWNGSTWIPATNPLGPYVYHGYFIISAAGSKVITGIPFKPSSIVFTANPNIDNANLDSDNISNNLNTADNVFGSMNGFAQLDTTIQQQVSFVGGSANSINDITRFASSSNCIGIRYANQNGNSLGKTLANLVSFDNAGYTLNVSEYTDSVLVMYTAYR